MKKIMLKTFVLLSALLSTAGINSAWAQFRDGGVYYFESAYLTGKSITSVNADKLTLVTTDESDTQQLWEVNEVSTGVFTFCNLANKQYLRSTNSNSGSSYWNTVATADANCQFSCTGPDANGTYAMRATNTSHTQHFMHAPSDDKVIGWEETSAASRWYIREVVVYDEAAVPGALSNLFSDAACTTLNKQFANEAVLTADIDYLKLPETLRNMAKKVYSGTWAEDNYDDTNSAWDSKYAQKYRVQLYEPYNDIMKASNALGINWHTNMNNPTGIFANNGDVLYIMVEGEIKEGAYLYLESYTGHGKTVDDYKKGQQLQAGLNIIECTADGSNYCINYIVETFDPSDGKRGNKAKARKLSDYDDLKIHIEGGYINGYYNKMGDALYEADKREDWNYIAERATQTDVTILGERIVLQFPLNDADTEGNKGMKYYLSQVSVEDVIDEWDNVMLWERLLLGVLGENTINAEAKQSPYSITQSKNVFEYTGKDGEFESDYSDYYNVHGLSFGVGGNAYMYGSGDHCGYHYNTMESIIQNILTNAGSHWGPGHEIGHQHQALLTVNGLMEVTNNLFSNVVLWYFGETTSRYNGTEGALSNMLAQFNAEGTDFFSNNIWVQTIMYYKLFLYYHVLGHNPKFYPRLFEMLRQDPMSTGYAQDGSKCLMHFYKKCCLAAGEDLTEFFRAHGFFEVMENRFVGDYSNSVYNLTQAQIDAAIKEIKDLGYKNNVSVLFVTDATGETIQSHKGDNLELYGETRVCAELGSYANFNNNTASAYTATVSGTTVTMSGEGGVGFAILNKKGELIGFSDKKTFELSLDAVEAILNGEANFVVVNGDATTTPATIDGNADERNKSLLGEMMESVKAFTNYEDATGKKIGYYKSSSLESMKAALEKAQTVYDNEEKNNYTAMFNALKQEYNAFIAADYNEIPMTAGTFLIKSCSNESQHLNVTDGQLTLTSTAEADLDNTAKWVFEKTASGKYYIKNLSTGNYIGALTKNNNVPALNTTGADAYEVVTAGNPGQLAIVYNEDLSFNNSHKGVIGWGYEGDKNSWWYITTVETDPIDANATQLKELLDKTQALYDQMAATPIPQVIPLTESSYFSNALQKGGAYPSDNFISYSVLCDGDPFTHFHSAYSGTNPGIHHYIRVDLGEEYKSDLFAFTYTNRSSNNRQNPTAITVEGSNEENGTYEHIVSLTTLDGLPTAEASSFESELLGTQGKTYRYLRFKVTETNSNAKFGDYPYFSITELGVLKGSFDITANTKYASNTITDAYMLEVFNALRQAKHDYRNATTADDYVRAYNALNTHYETLLEAYNDVKDAGLAVKKAQLNALIENTTMLIGQCGEVNYIPATFESGALLQVTDPNSKFYISTNAQASNEGPISGLIDDVVEDVANNTYFHSDYSGNNSTDGLDHYIQVNLGESVKLFKFTYTNRHNTDRNYATKMTIWGSTDGEIFEEITRIEGLPASASSVYTSDPINVAKEYTYLRFMVTESTSAKIGGHHFFHMAEFDLFIGTPESYSVQLNQNIGKVTEDLLLATYKENQEALGTHTYATTEAQLDKAIADLQAQYDALEAAKNFVDKSVLADLMTTATDKLNECGTVTPNGDALDVTFNEEHAGSVNKNMLRDLYRAIETAQGVIANADVTQEEVDAALETLSAQIEIIKVAQQSTAKAELKVAIDAAQTAIEDCASNITKENDGYIVVWKSETAGDVDKATLIAAYEALAQANAVYNGEASTVSEYQAAKDALSTPIATLNEYKTGDCKSQLKSKVDLLTALIKKCNTEGLGDLTTGMLEEMVQLNETATAYLTQEFATQEVLVSTIEGAISNIESNYPAWSAAQQSTAKEKLREMIAQLEDLIGLIEACRVTETNTVTRNEVCTLQTTDANEEFYLSTNATLYEGETANLVDEDMNTFFQTKSGVGAEHYLLVDAGEGNALKKFKFSYQSNKSPFPYTIKVYGSNEKEAEFIELATFSKDDVVNPLPTSTEQRWTSSEIGNGTAYRYLRFNVTKSGVTIKLDENKEIDTSNGSQLSNKYKSSLYTETPLGEYCFAMSDFDLTNIVDEKQQIDILAGTVTEEQLTEADDAAEGAKTLADNSAIKEDLEAKNKELETLYTELFEATGIQVNLTATQESRDRLLIGIEYGKTIGTFSAPYATRIPDGVTAYYAEQEYEGGTVSLTAVEEGKALPANQGVILIGAVGLNSVNFYPATDEDEQADLSANTFSNSAKCSVVMESNDYILAIGDPGIGFYQATPGTTLNQRKAFFRLTAGSGPLSLVLKFGGSATDINAVTTDTPSDDELIYDIYGRRVTEVKKGSIYIKNGKKFIVK